MTLFIQHGCPVHGPDIEIESFACDGITLTVTCLIRVRDEIEATEVRSFVFGVPTMGEPTEDENFDASFQQMLMLVGGYIATGLQEEIEASITNMSGPN